MGEWDVRNIRRQNKIVLLVNQASYRIFSKLIPLLATRKYTQTEC